jgi:hypothetical protein
MIIMAFPAHNPATEAFLTQAGVTITREHSTKVSLHIPDESTVEELSGANFRKYKKITTPNGKVFELDYFHEETQNRMMIAAPKNPHMTEYPICPLVGVEAQKYLINCGCSVFSEALGLPTSLTLDQQTDSVTLDHVILFQMRQMKDLRWLVILPRPYQDTLRHIFVTHHLNSQTISKILHIPETVMFDILNTIPVPRQVAVETLQRLSEHTGDPYSLENVRVEVCDA